MAVVVPLPRHATSRGSPVFTETSFILSSPCSSYSLRRVWFAQNAANRVAGYQQFFVGRNHPRLQPGISRTDLRCPPDGLRVLIDVDCQPRPLEALTDARANLRRVLPHASREDHRVRSAHPRQQDANVFPCPITENQIGRASCRERV